MRRFFRGQGPNVPRPTLTRNQRGATCAMIVNVIMAPRYRSLLVFLGR